MAQEASAAEQSQQTGSSGSSWPGLEQQWFMSFPQFHGQMFGTGIGSDAPADGGGSGPRIPAAFFRAAGQRGPEPEDQVPGALASSPGVPRGVVAAFARRNEAAALGDSGTSDALGSAKASSSAGSRPAAESTVQEAAWWPELGMQHAAQFSAADMQQLAEMQRLMAAQQAQMKAVSDREQPLEQQLAVHQEVTVAQQTQYLQQCQFYSQLRQYESQRNSKGSTVGEVQTRFKDGFRPMQTCRKLFRLGSCPRGDDCTFAHSYEELHPASPDFPGAEETGTGTEALAVQTTETPFNAAAEPAMRMKKKREMCHRLARGGCLLGKKCMFAHEESELGTVALVITDRVKTQICRFWESGKCIYGKYCVNAHGMEEIGTLKPPEELCPPSKIYKQGNP
mmetsp:Transcript_61999/g.134402  ORF Transcript_61999/g.134402 Transcript_61999/m.134402 type:complete len:395 (+) Transcript_61999:228-1412(+)